MPPRNWGLPGWTRNFNRLALSHEATKHGPAFGYRMQPRLQPTAEFKELILRRLRESMSHATVNGRS